MAALRLDGIFPEINETGIMPGLFEMEGQIGIVFQGNNDAFFISFYILDVDRFFDLLFQPLFFGDNFLIHIYCSPAM